MDHLLTRRQTIQSLAYAAVLGGPLLSLVGCGGGGHHGGGGSASTTDATVAVQLPSGFTIPVGDLVGGTAYSTAPIASGGFKAKISPKGPTFAYVQQKSTGKYVLFGLVGSGRPGVTPLATAALMLAVTLGITGLPGDTLAQALTLLEADASVQDLGTTIATAMTSDPYAANGTNDAVKAALATAYAALSGTGSRAAAQPRDSGTSLLLVSPTGDQGGFRLDQVDDGTVTPTNLKRRAAVAYTYLVGHTTADATTDVSPATRLDVQEILATTGFIGSLTSLGVQGAYGPRAGKVVKLPVANGDVKTLYSTIVLMASADQGAEPAFFADAHYANEVAEWRQKRKDLNAAGFVGILRDVFAPLVAATVDLSVAAASALVTNFAASTTASYLAQAQAGQYGEFITYTLGEVGHEGYTIGKAIAFVEECIGASPSVVSSTFLAALLGYAAVAASALAVATSALALADIAASYYDVVSSPQGEIWAETAIKPSVAISPSSGKIYKGGSVTLTAATPGVSETKYKFHWTLSSGGNGNIGDPSGTGGAGRDITTAGNSINLLTAASDVEGTVYAISVTAIELATGTALGTAKATVTISSEDPGQTGQYFSVMGPITSGTYAGNYFFASFVRFTPMTGAVSYSALAQAADGTTGTGQVPASYLPYQAPDGRTFDSCVLVAGSLEGQYSASEAFIEVEKHNADAQLSGLDWKVYTHY